jgi:hypothetical protein
METRQERVLEIKKYLVLKGQVFFRDMKSGVSLNSFEFKNVWCETPKSVLSAPEQFPIIVAALRLGHLTTSDSVPTATEKAEKRGSPMFELLQSQFDAFSARINAMRSVDVIDQLIDMEERRTPELGGPRRQYLNTMLGRRAKLVEDMQKDEGAAYSSEQSPSRPAVVARQEIKISPEPKKARTAKKKR